MLKRVLVNPGEDSVAHQEQRNRWAWRAAGYEHKEVREDCGKDGLTPAMNRNLNPSSIQEKTIMKKKIQEGEKTSLRVFPNNFILPLSFWLLHSINIFLLIDSLS